MFVPHFDSAHGTRISCPGLHDSPTGGLGLRSAERIRWPAYWASWADTLPMTRERHPEVADLIVYHLEGGASSPWVQLVGLPQPSMGWMGLKTVTACPTPAHHGSGGQGTWCPTAGVAACSCNQDRVQFPDRNSGAQDESRGTGTVEVTEWAVCWGHLLCLSQFSTHANRLSFVPGASPAPPPSPSSFVPAHLRVWPATRSFWPSPPQHVRDWGFGKEGLRSGECGRQSLQGSWGQSRDEHVCARHGLGGACGWRQQALGSGRRRVDGPRG